MSRALALPILLATLLVLAGCAAPLAQGPAATSEGSAAATRGSSTTAQDATTTESALEQQTPASGSNALSVNASRVYDRAAASLDSDVAEPDIRTLPAEDAGAISYGGQLDPFHRLLLDADERESRTPAAYYESGAHRVTVVLHDGVPAAAANASELRAVLAHEFAHAVTFRDERYRDPMTQVASGGTTDAARIRTAMVEGSAMLVSDAYSERYLDGFDHGRAMARDYRGGDELWRYLRGPYRFGGRYFDRRLDSPANLTRAFRTSPESTEQLIHGFAPGEEPPTDLRVDVSAASGEDASAAGEDGTGDSEDANADDDVAVGRTDTTGELFVRDLLGGRLSEQRAASAAAGWGNDRVVTVWNHSADESGQRNFVWALRWDDGRNATEFERAFTDYLDARGERVDAQGEYAGDRQWRVAGERFRLVRASDRTVAVVIGEPETVGGVEISADDGEVSVTA